MIFSTLAGHCSVGTSAWLLCPHGQSLKLNQQDWRHLWIGQHHPLLRLKLMNRGHRLYLWQVLPATVTEWWWLSPDQVWISSAVLGLEFQKVHVTFLLSIFSLHLTKAAKCQHNCASRICNHLASQSVLMFGVSMVFGLPSFCCLFHARMGLLVQRSADLALYQWTLHSWLFNSETAWSQKTGKLNSQAKQTYFQISRHPLRLEHHIQPTLLCQVPQIAWTNTW